MPNSPNFQAEAVVEKLGDRELLRNYCNFAGMHRAIIGDILFRNLSQDPIRRRSIALEITANWVAALEDVALWFFALKEWGENRNVLLFDLLDSIQVSEREGAKYITQRALDELAGWTADDMRCMFGLPSDEQLLSWGWTKDMVTEHVAALAEALNRIKQALAFRVQDEGVLVSGYNKIKHGVLAVAASEHSSIGVSVMVPSRRGPKDPVTGKRKINVGWIPCEDKELHNLIRSTLLVCEALWAILCLLYWTRFDNAWVRPEWPVLLPAAQ